MLEKHKVIEQVKTFFAEKLFVEIGADDENLTEAGALDSMGIVELLLFLERTYGVEFPMQEIEMEDLQSVGSIAQMVRGRAELTAASEASRVGDPSYAAAGAGK